MDALHREIIRRANGMEIFADGEPTITWGEWRQWEADCYAAGKLLPPAEWKENYRKAKAELKAARPEQEG